MQFTQSYQPYMYQSESLFLNQNLFLNPYHAAFSNGASIRIVHPLDRCAIRMPLVPIPLSFRSAGIVHSVVKILSTLRPQRLGRENNAPKKDVNKPAAPFQESSSLNLTK